MENSRDFKEITFAITLLAGIFAFLFKVNEYFNNNVITMGGSFQFPIYLLVLIAIVILLSLSIFLLLKWYLISITYENKPIKNITEKLFKNISIYTTIWIIILILSFTVDYYVTNPPEIDYINVLMIFIIFLVVFCVVILLDYKTFKKVMPIIKDDLLSMYFKITNKNILNLLSILMLLSKTIFALSIIIVIFSPIPSYLLMGSYSIEQFPTSNTDNAIFLIKETGIPLVLNHIILYKINDNESNIFQYIDNITIKNTHGTTSKNKLMTGIKHEGIWYLNVNTSNLSFGTYNIHAEVTNDLSVKYIFGTIKKHDDKLFYVAPRSSKFYSNITE